MDIKQNGGRVMVNFKIERSLRSYRFSSLYHSYRLMPVTPMSTRNQQYLPQMTDNNADDISIPGQIGQVKKGRGQGQIDNHHIQAAHCNYEAQSNIARIIETLVKDHNVKLVAVEGPMDW
jgi:hypothetical protein